MSNLLTVYRVIELFFIVVVGAVFVVTITNKYEMSREIFLIIFSCITIVLFTTAFIFLVPSKLTKKEKFKQYYGFHPKLLSDQSYQKQVMCKLIFLSKHVCDAQLGVKKQLTALEKIHKMFNPPEDQQEGYEQTLMEYMSHMELLHYYQPEFAATIPHWTQLYFHSKDHCEKKHCRTDDFYIKELHEYILETENFIKKIDQRLLNQNN